MTLPTGFVLNSRYRIARLIGQGGFGAVYRAWDTALNQAVALKANSDISAEGKRQFVREATILAGLHHPNLPRVTDHFVIPNQAQYLVMDYVDGDDLEHMMERSGRLPEAEVIAWIQQVCDALSYLHSRTPPIIHRDIKPANVKITPEGRAVLVDFGISKIYDPHNKTTQGARAVTSGYSPPEQYGSGTTDARSDVYSLGATLYTLLTGQEPPDAVDLMVGNEQLAPPQTLNPDISPHVAASIEKALTSQPTDRFATTGAIKKALTTPHAAARLVPIADKDATASRPVGGNWMPLAAGIIALFTIVGFGAWFAAERSNVAGGGGVSAEIAFATEPAPTVPLNIPTPRNTTTPIVVTRIVREEVLVVITNTPTPTELATATPLTLTATATTAATRTRRPTNTPQPSSTPHPTATRIPQPTNTFPPPTATPNWNATATHDASLVLMATPTIDRPYNFIRILRFSPSLDTPMADGSRITVEFEWSMFDDMGFAAVFAEAFLVSDCGSGFHGTNGGSYLNLQKGQGVSSLTMEVNIEADKDFTAIAIGANLWSGIRGDAKVASTDHRYSERCYALH